MSKATHIYMEIQPDWEQCRDESCWMNVSERTVDYSPTSLSRKTIHCSITTSPTTHYQVPVDTTGNELRSSRTDLNTDHLVSITNREMNWIELCAVNERDRNTAKPTTTVFQSPRRTLDVSHPMLHTRESPSHNILRPQLNSVDISCDERYMVVGAVDGLCRVWELNDTSKHAIPLEGHLTDVTRTRFFPSGKVILTASLDFTLRIWDVMNGQCAATLVGHSGSVNDVAMIGRGRTVLSGANGGEVHMWSCGTQQIVAKWGMEDTSSVHTLALRQDSTEVDGTMVFAGLENGHLVGIDVRAPSLALSITGVSQSVTPSPVFSCAVMSEHSPLMLTGTEDGLLTIWDERNISEPLEIVSRSSSAIHRIMVDKDRQVWTAHADGTCATWNDLVCSKMTRVCNVLTGPQYDPIRDFVCTSTTSRVFTACRDGFVREYIPHIVDI